MKKLICLLLLCALVLFAAWPNFTYDAAQTFEAALSGSWSETDGAGIITPQSTTDKYRGTYAMQVASGSTAESNVNYAISPAKATLSIGFWYKSGTYGNWEGDRTIAYIYNDANGVACAIREGRSAGDNARGMVMNLSATRITLANATWYWVTLQYVQNGTSSLAVYDTAGAQVGSTVTGTAPNYIANSVRFGTYAVASSTPTYFDEIYIDYADATFPLGPPTDDAAGRRRVVLTQ